MPREEAAACWYEVLRPQLLREETDRLDVDANASGAAVEDEADGPFSFGHAACERQAIDFGVLLHISPSHDLLAAPVLVAAIHSIDLIAP
jgi:hypothetical protein